ncbi:MAG: M20 family metallopeptidase [Dehalococcoidia bacterium]
MTDLAALVARKRRAQQAIDQVSEDLRTLSLEIHAHPELNFEEERAHQLLTLYLQQNGFTVERGAYEMPTAFRAVAGSGSPVVAVLCEYDALPGIGHACGHNLIAASGIAAGLALKEVLGEGEGTVIVLGSPAEEGGGGKVYMIERGAFDGVDAAMMLHPAPVDVAWPNFLAIQTLEVEYHGHTAHAAAAPHEGLNALDALVLAYNGISMLRQQFRQGVRVHGVIHHGGDKPNIIPDHAAAEFYVRAKDERDLEEIKAKVLACFEGAATATGCRLEHRWTSKPYTNLATNDPMAEAYVENAKLLGIRLPAKGEGTEGMAASTDMGNVSHVLPSIHPVFAIRTRASNHTPEFTGAAATPEAHTATLSAAKALAMTALDLYFRPELLAAAKQDFRTTHPEAEFGPPTPNPGGV